ncbi:hypothetical protein TWF173_007903 [Orbilia oligospora]|uniref:MICOS complex subunit n=2 Tax=Orbilia oligospora TaxID=2813651 RepID=G1XG78_ARTOA|nr:hypothetical protein AOL_s00083g8 [Orbilia oligospora ATCC 24927]EGX47853.1 hypothetical protein AOL_s00083g8 [Orbilia oligospora ATCC 24927]KAF3275615.1 hypothetical protein TWF970_006782 [Orbilia oligospora]KAF3318496.1 hypothetical protein TWF173_007903 [Orbilia oligospora]
MAARLPLNPRAMALLTGLSVTTLAGYTTTSTVYAEEPSQSTKKSIYDDPLPSQPPSSTPSLSLTSPSETSDKESRPTPTVRLASQIGTARLFVHSEFSKAQRFLDTYFDKYLHVEHNVTTTVASLAPSHRSKETVLPGAIFIAISTMAGSVLARRRMLPIRFLTPVVTGVAASWYFLPETTRNVADLAWKWEQKVPQVAETHLKVRDGVEEGWKTAKGGYDHAIGTVEDTTSKARRTIEGWVRNSK